MAFNLGSLGRLVVSVGTDLSDLDKGLRSADNKIAATAVKFENVTNKIGTSVTKLGFVVTAAVGLTAKAASDFESAFAGVRKTVDASEAEFEQLAQNFKNLSKEIPTSAVELAKIGEIAGQLGIRGVAEITKFTKTIAQLGDTTDISGEQAALSLSRFINIMGTAQKDVDRLGAAIVALGNNFAARESEILDLSLSLAAFGRQINLSESDVLAFSTIIRAAGGEAQAASTAFQKVALTMKDAVLTGGADLEKFAKIAGQTSEEFQKAFEEDAAEAFTKFLEGLKRIDEEGGSLKQSLEEIGLADQRLVREFGKVINSTDDLRRALKLSADAFDANTALAEEAEKRYATTASQLKILKNNILDAAITIGSFLLPAINAMIQKILPVLKVIATWIENNRELAAEIAVLVAKIGLIALAVGPAIIILGKLATVLALLVSPIGLVVVAVGALVTAWVKDFGGIRQVTIAVVQKIGETLDSLRSAVLKTVLTFQNLADIPLRERLVHPIDSMRQAVEQADNAVAALAAQEGPLSEFGEVFAGTLEEAGARSDGFVQRITQAKSDIDALFAAEKVAAAGGGGGVKAGSGDEGASKGGKGGGAGAKAAGGLATASDMRLANIESNFEKEQEATKKHLGIIGKLKEVFFDAETRVEQTKDEIISELREQSYNRFKSILRQQADTSKNAARALKAIAIGEVIIDTAKGVAKALSLGPIGVPLAAIIGALGAAEIATITGVEFAKGSDNVPFRGITDPGEIVVPRTFADAIRQNRLTLGGPGGGGGNQGGTSVSIGRIVIENPILNTDQNIEELAEKLGANISAKIGNFA